MADGLSLIANVIAVGGLVVSSSQGLIDLVTTVRNASREVQGILNDTRAFCNVIVVLNSCLREPDRQNAIAQDSDLLELVANLREPMEHCTETITLLKRHLRGRVRYSAPVDGGRSIRMIAMNAIWYFKKRKEVEKLLVKLDREKHTLAVLISALNFRYAVTRETQADPLTDERQQLSQRGQCGSDCTDLDFALKRYLGDTWTICSDANTSIATGSLNASPSDNDVNDNDIGDNDVDNNEINEIYPQHQLQKPKMSSMVSLGTTQLMTNHLNLSRSFLGSTAEEQLWRACSHGSFYQLLKCWQPGVDIDAMFETGLTCLHVASSRGDSAIVQFLINHGANVMARANPDTPSSHHHMATPLHMAARQGRAKAIAQLLKAGADVNAKDAALCTPLHGAYMSHSQIAFLDLLKHGAQSDELDCDGLAVLHHAAADGDFGMVSHLLDYGATINLPSGPIKSLETLGLKSNNRTPLHMAACEQTGLHHEEDRKAIIDLLTRSSSGRILEARDSNGYTPLHVAAMNESCALLVHLLGLGANPNAREFLACETPLHKAARLGRFKIVEALLSHSADPNDQNFSGKSAKDLAALRGHQDILDLIEHHLSASCKVGNLGEHALYQIAEKLSFLIQSEHSICV